MKQAKDKKLKLEKIKKIFSLLFKHLNIPNTSASVSCAHRAAQLWANVLLKGHQQANQPPAIKTLPYTGNGLVCLTHIGIHLVCPHHFTVAFGQAHIIIAPDKDIAGWGALHTIIEWCTAKMVLQEQATKDIAFFIGQALQVKSIGVMLEASHPCYQLLHPSAHRSEITTWAYYKNIQNQELNTWTEQTMLSILRDRVNSKK
jgi:GTP cyclohydrolase I